MAIKENYIEYVRDLLIRMIDHAQSADAPTPNFSTASTMRARLRSLTICSRPSRTRFSKTNHPALNTFGHTPEAVSSTGGAGGIFNKEVTMDDAGRLIITRKSGEALRIITGDTASIITFTIDAGRLRLSIQAPKSVKFYREELIFKTSAATTTEAK